MMVSVPSAALGAEPVTGASRKLMPRAARLAPISRAALAPIVDMSTTSSPRGPTSAGAAATWAPSTSMVNSTSAARAAAAGDDATAAPCSSAHASALARVRFKTVSSWPASARCAACSEPMMPSPSQATFMRCSLGESHAVGDGGRLRAAADVELGKDPRDVHAGRLLGHVQLGADLAVRRAAGDEREHLALARRQAERVAVSVRDWDDLLLGVVDPQPRPGDEPLDLAAEPVRAQPARDVERVGRGLARGLAVGAADQRLGAAPQRHRPRVGP